jgi:uncharacterized membrane protein
MKQENAMTQLLLATSTTLHALAMIVFIGHYLLLSRVYLPALSNVDTGARALGEMSRRSRPWLYTSILVFAVTGVHLMLVDPNYLGIGNFSNPWAMLMLIKHLVIVVMIGLGFWFNAVQRVGPVLRSNTAAAQGVEKFRQYCNAMAVGGVLVLALTALSQVQ